jgi:hypothetical protein
MTATGLPASKKLNENGQMISEDGIEILLDTDVLALAA